MYFALIRPYHWLKNIFIFLPIFFGQRLSDTSALLATSAAFGLFCLLASGVYILNDYHDRHEDGAHPTKRTRPLAAGTVSPEKAIGLMVLFFGASLGSAYLLHPMIFFLMIGYLAINIAYTFFLREVALIDIACISIGFVLRVFVGAYSSAVHPSFWLIIMTFLLAFFLALSKRRNEVMTQHEGGSVRESIERYNTEFLNGALFVMAGVIIVSYIMYTISPDVTARINQPYLYMTTFFVILGILRYLQVILTRRTSLPLIRIFSKDPFFLSCIGAWGVTFAVLLYAPSFF